MLIVVASVKGSPGVTSTALALAAAWPREVVLVEGDPTGGDLAFRCTNPNGGPVPAGRGIVTLGAAVRAGEIGGDTVAGQAQSLKCGVQLVQGVSSHTQAKGIGAYWPEIARAGAAESRDVIVDAGRIDPGSPHLPLLLEAQLVLPVVGTEMAQVMHLVENIGLLAANHAAIIQPVLIGPRGTAARDAADVTTLLERAAVTAQPTRGLPIDEATLRRLEAGESFDGKLAKRPLAKDAGELAAALLGAAGTRQEIEHEGSDR